MTIIPNITYRNWSASLHAQAYMEVHRLRAELVQAETKLGEAQTAALDKYDGPWNVGRHPITVILAQGDVANGEKGKALVIQPPNSGRSSNAWSYTISEVVS